MSGAVILLLAAGASTRMRGGDKLLEEVEGTALLARVAGRAAKAGRLRVALPEGDAARADALCGLECEIITVAPGRDMSHSLIEGARGLKSPLLIVLADMPEVSAHDMHLILALSAQAPKAIIRGATKDGQAGHPVLIPADLIPEIQHLTGDQGARDLIRRHSGRVHLLPLPGRNAITDLDTPEDWARWRKAQLERPETGR